jgi:hypothetical protein
MTATVQISTSSIDEVLKQNTRQDRRRRTIAGLIALGTVIAAGVSWTMFQPPNQSASGWSQHTVPATNASTDPVYFPAQYVNQGTTESAESTPTF